MMKPESKPIAESKIPESKLKQAKFKIDTLFLYWFIIRIYR